MRFEEARRCVRCLTGPEYLGACAARLARTMNIVHKSFAAQPPASVDAICDDESPDLRNTE